MAAEPVDRQNWSAFFKVRASQPALVVPVAQEPARRLHACCRWASSSAYWPLAWRLGTQVRVACGSPACSHDEITRYRVSARNWSSPIAVVATGTLEVTRSSARPPVQATTYIQQYKFIRLEKRANYEGLDPVSQRPATGLTTPAIISAAEQLRRPIPASPPASIEELKTVGPRTDADFSPQDHRAVHPRGPARACCNERHHKPAHQPALHRMGPRRHCHAVEYVQPADSRRPPTEDDANGRRGLRLSRLFVTLSGPVSKRRSKPPSGAR